ncbi:hypothetical protein DFR48_10749 [Ciceribacter lividus]|uniref:Uncharacterized protein n=1 Tax=Ciceribacter lividus TaxID=1197950 RepID=A0A6I7HJP6_9HYPH|nr:hypothetical protein [Ciceribacter lividus]RCW23180.1 hypothetical protein DFR48_10749 [Ciceribacter lividus]
MKKTLLWTVGGLAMATACGLVGLAHLSATLITLTTFFAVPAFLVVAFDALPLRQGRQMKSERVQR